MKGQGKEPSLWEGFRMASYNTNGCREHNAHPVLQITYNNFAACQQVCCQMQTVPRKKALDDFHFAEDAEIARTHNAHEPVLEHSVGHASRSQKCAVRLTRELLSGKLLTWLAEVGTVSPPCTLPGT